MSYISDWVRDRIAKHAESNTHITEQERTDWNNKTDDTAVNQHASDEDAHITVEDRSNWNNKLDVAQSSESANMFVKTDANGDINVFKTLTVEDLPDVFVSESEVTPHLDDVSMHAASGDKDRWTEYPFFFADIVKLTPESCASLFQGKSKLTRCPSLNTSSETDFSNMFNGCTALKSVSTLDATQGTDFKNMFYQCSSLTTIPELKVSNGLYFTNMFFRCTSLTSLKLTGCKYSFDISPTALTGASLEALYTSLGTAELMQKITVTQTQYDSGDITIAQTKNWGFVIV